jgi:hypothetical protein
MGVTISANYAVLPHGERHKHVVRRYLTDDVNPWLRCESILAWLPDGAQRLLWLSRWDTYPPGEVVLIETIRRGCGEQRGLYDSPGHLFEPTSYANYDDRAPTEIAEAALMTSLFMLAASLGWDAAVFSQQCDDYISVSDRTFFFWSTSGGRLSVTPK